VTNVTRQTDRLRVGVVGLGYWGPNILRVAHEIEGLSVAAGCDSDPDALERQRRRYPLLQLVSDPEQLWADDSIDAVVLATPVSTHFSLAKRALDAGKHVLVEKPLAATVPECRALIELADARGLVVMPGHTFVYSPPVLEVKRMLDAGELGRIHFITSSRVNLGIHQRDISVIRDLAPHDFSILLHWLGSANFVRTIGRDAVVPGVVDIAFIDLGYDDGCLAHLDLSWLAPTKLRRTVLVGDRKMVIYEDTSPEQIRVYDRRVEIIEPQSFGEFQLSYRSGDILTPRLDVTEPLKLELQDFVEAVTTGKRPRSDAEFGLEVVRMVQATERSLTEGGSVVGLKPGAPEPIEHEPSQAFRTRPRLATGNGRPQPFRVPFLDLGRSTRPLAAAMRECFETIAAEGEFTLGEELERFEHEFATFCGAEGCVGVSDGTAALQLALSALGVGPGDEVITVPFTFVGTVEAIRATGADVVFVDIDPHTRTIAPGSLETALGPRTRAVVPVHLYGRPVPMREIRALCNAAGVAVLEDAAQAHGARLGSRRVGALGTAAAFSFYPTKNLGALGDGGAVVSDDLELIETVRSLRHHGSLPDDPNCHVREGTTSRLHNLQAALLRLKLPLLERWNAERREAAALYRELLADAPLTLPPEDPPFGEQVYHLFVVELDERDRVREGLGARGIETGVHYPLPVHLQPVWRERGYAPGDFPASEALAGRALSLPLFPGITEGEVLAACEALRVAAEESAPSERIARGAR
jgi:dTDP-4-amino-4,6-dideoxygalactose transaminase/predicted dehydrogenase